MSDDEEEDQQGRALPPGRAQKKSRRATSPLPRDGDEQDDDGERRERGESGRGRRGKGKGQGRRETTPLPAGMSPRLRTWLAFGGGVLTGLLALPLLLALLLGLFGGDESLRPTPPPQGQPDLTVDLSRSYLERTASISANKRKGLLKVQDPQVELAPHPAGGVRMVLHAQLEIPVVGSHGLVATLQLAPVGGELAVATEQIALGQGGKIEVPGRLIEGWIDDMVNDAVQERLQANARYRVEVIDVSAGADNLIIKAFLRER